MILNGTTCVNNVNGRRMEKGVVDTRSRGVWSKHTGRLARRKNGVVPGENQTLTWTQTDNFSDRGCLHWAQYWENLNVGVRKTSYLFFWELFSSESLQTARVVCRPFFKRKISSCANRRPVFEYFTPFSTQFKQFGRFSSEFTNLSVSTHENSTL